MLPQKDNFKATKNTHFREIMLFILKWQRYNIYNVYTIYINILYVIMLKQHSSETAESEP